LDVSSPSDGQGFNKNQVNTGNTINVAGKTDQGVSVTVNGFWAVVDDNNNFSYTLPLQNGDNQIKIVAVDLAGNKTEKDLKVNFSQ
jgi:bacillopeptidase F